jgi:hypothetical protein
MNLITRNVIPSIYVLRLLGNTQKFQTWLSRKHPTIQADSIFFGYQFCVQCCFSNLFDALANDTILGFTSSDLLDFATTWAEPLHKLEHDCNKIIFLKNINKEIKNVAQAKSYAQLNISFQGFDRKVGVVFDKFFDNHISVKKNVKISKQELLGLKVIHFVHKELNQVNNGGPQVHEGTLTGKYWLNEFQLANGFEGYKYAVQFIWSELVGEQMIENSSLNTLHLADSWRTYKYKPLDKDVPEDMAFFMGREYEEGEQTNFDSYYGRIEAEIIPSFRRIMDIDPVGFREDFKVTKKGYDIQSYFAEFLNSTELTDPYPNLSWSDKVHSRLYWRSFQVIEADKSGTHVGVPTFNVMLAGCVALLGDGRQNDKIYVARFTHPLGGDKSKNHYSYGIYIDSQATGGRNYSGWVIYTNACGDFSGYSGMEHDAAEDLIKKYKRAKKISIRDLVIPWKDFEPIIRPYLNTSKEVSLLSKNEAISNVLSEARGHLLELFVGYLVSRNLKNFNIHVNVDRGKEEKDIVLINEDEVKIVECKLNPQNHDLDEVIEKIEKRLAQYKQKTKTCELWFWENLSSQNETTLRKRNIVYVEVQAKRHPFLQSIDISLMKFIMQDVGASAYKGDKLVEE